jgi:hypothetical protein
MAKSKFRIGDKVKVVGMSPVTFPPGVKDERGTEKLFKSMLGKVYTVRGFDQYGNVELEPKRLNAVWVEPEFLKLRARNAARPSENCRRLCRCWETRSPGVDITMSTMRGSASNWFFVGSRTIHLCFQLPPIGRRHRRYRWALY